MAALKPMVRFIEMIMTHTSAFVFSVVSRSSVTANAVFVRTREVMVVVARLLRTRVNLTGS